MANIETRKISQDLVNALVAPANKDEVVLVHATLKATEVAPELLQNGLKAGYHVVNAFNVAKTEFADRVKGYNGTVMYHTFFSKTKFTGPISDEEAIIALPVRALMSLADDSKVVSLRYAKPHELKRFCGPA
ncbi:MAG: hypothetical protein WCD70_01590 [Alphaproteobacteria bacterium]